MKYEGFKEVKSICYPNDYVVNNKRSNLLNVIIINLALCLTVAVGVLFAKYLGGGAKDVINVIADALNSGLPV